MTSWLPVLPVALSLTTAVLCFLCRRSGPLHRAVSLGGGAIVLGACLVMLRAVAEGVILVTPLGGWVPPVGIGLVGDPLSALAAVTAAAVALACIAAACATIDEMRERGGFHAFLHVTMAGCYGAFLTGDVFNLYVWFEVVLIGSFALMVLGGEARQLEGGIKYFVLNFIGTSLLLVAVALLYGLTGTLAMADIATRLPAVAADSPALVSAVAILLLGAFATKGALVPLFFWLPASYHTTPPVVSALFAALLTKVGLYAVVRLFSLVFPAAVVPGVHGVILGLAGATIVIGVLGSLVERDVRRILSFQVVGHMGYIAMGVGLASPLALAGATFYLVHDMVVKAALFLTAAVAARMAGGTFALAAGGGLMRQRPGVALMLFLPAFSLAGIPPLSGFWGKLILVRAGLEQGAWAISAAALLGALLTVFAVARLWSALAWEDPPRPLAPVGGRHAGWLTAAAAAMAAATVALGLFAEPVIALAREAATILTDRDAYIRAVLTSGGPP